MEAHRFTAGLIISCLILWLAPVLADEDPGLTAADEQPVLTRPFQAEQLIGLEFDEAERDTMQLDLVEQLQSYLALRELELPNDVPPSLLFQPLPPGTTIPTEGSPPRWTDPGSVTMPGDIDRLAFYTVGELGVLIRSGELSSLELTRFCLDRLRRHDPTLLCVVTLTESIALRQAARADSEIAVGKYRGPLHGIPYGVKDLCAVAGTPTTWGAEPHRDQVIDATATVVRKLEAAGAVLVAKLTLGALAWGDVWFGGMTRNPWNTETGSSGSSAGPSSAVAAGLVPFAIGSETWGSIVSPCTVCGVTGLRPTFGRVSRFGAMALSWSMDKLGPICRSVEDCALVFDVIRGADGLDQTVLDSPFPYRSDIDLSQLRIGYLAADFEGEYEGSELDGDGLAALRRLGAKLIPMELPDFPVQSLAFILSAEAAAAFDQLTLTGDDDLLTRQIRYAWPNTFRAARFIPAVEYIQANRARHLLCREMANLFEKVDLYVSPSFQGDNLLLTNLTGHPCVVVPNGFLAENTPWSITFIGDLHQEATLLAVARAYQDATGFHLKHPIGF